MMMIRRRRPTAILDEVDVHGADFDVDVALVEGDTCSRHNAVRMNREVP